jgi:integrase
MENPATSVRFFRVNNQRLRFLDRDEEAKLLSACSPSIKPIIVTALNTGMRRGEILALQWEQVDFANELITVKDSKNGEPRNIPMNSCLADLFRTVRIDSQSPYVFHSRNGSRYKSIQWAWCEALRKAGIHDFRFHDLRHTFASRLVMAGVDLVTVKELLGHKSINMTMRYSHLSQDHKKKAVRLLSRQHMDTEAENKDRAIAITG